MHHRSILALVPAALLAAATSLAAQEMTAPAMAAPLDQSKTRGFMIGAHANAAAIAPSEGSAERGFGGGLRAGYGITDHVTVFGEADGASINYKDEEGSYTMIHVGAGVRGSTATPAAKARPYFEAALVAVSLADDVEGHDVTFTGGSVQFGLGVEYFVSRTAALDVGMEVGPGKFTSASVDGESAPFEDLNFTSVRLNVGFTFHP
jgi:hypothetical protein